MIENYDKQKFENNLDLNIMIIYESFKMRDMLIDGLRKNCKYCRKISNRQYEIGCIGINFDIIENSYINTYFDRLRGTRWSQIIVEENVEINKKIIDMLLFSLTKRVGHSNKLIDLSEYCKTINY